ncbi:hypothetical protein ACKF11_13000 [Methylobacillus sp. Pita2]|uniref:hypothetical protein n=1 Tax=Methylobacillus sp. Pita2 TaxID=3383245 RepID=UPI0038B49A15
MANGAKNAAPFLSSSAGIKAGDANVGLTLWKNLDKSKENMPDVTGYINKDGQKTYVVGWLIAGGTKEGKEYLPFISLRADVPDGSGNYSRLLEGTGQGMNTYKGEPVTETHRSRLLANLKNVQTGETFVASGYATEGLVNDEELAKALGFTTKIVGGTPKQEQPVDDGGVADQQEHQESRRQNPRP